MSKGLRVVLAVLAGFLCISLLHVWLNIGFEKLAIVGTKRGSSSLRVGYLPVT
jgi:hypothetical protein